MTKSRKSRRKNNPCLECPAYCCHDLATPIDKPRENSDIEDVRWQLQYDTVSVAIRNHRWYQVVKGRCIYLDTDNMCRIYDKRPRKCKDHNPPECEKYYPWYDVIINTPEQFDKHLGLDKGKRKRGRKRSKEQGA